MGLCMGYTCAGSKVMGWGRSVRRLGYGIGWKTDRWKKSGKRGLVRIWVLETTVGSVMELYDGLCWISGGGEMGVGRGIGRGHPFVPIYEPCR